MAYTSKERVMAAFNHEEPDRVPAWCGASIEFWEASKETLNMDDEGLLQRFGDDFRRVFAQDVDTAISLSPGSHYRTPFGVERHGHGYGQPTSHPLANAGIKEIIDYNWPDGNLADVSMVRSDALKFGNEYAILGGAWSPYWHDAIDLLGMENLYYKMYDEPELVDTILENIMKYYLKVSQRIFDEASDLIDIFFIGNDFGSQTGPLLGEDLFRRYMLPHLKDMVDLGHDYGKKVLLHCCGGIAQLIPSMIEIGLDGIHAVQPSCLGMDLPILKKSFGDKILLNGAIDSHHILINGTPQTVIENTKKVLKIMMPGGGYVAGASHDSILLETPLENIIAMFDTIREFGVYKK